MALPEEVRNSFWAWGEIIIDDLLIAFADKKYERHRLLTDINVKHKRVQALAEDINDFVTAPTHEGQGNGDY